MPSSEELDPDPLLLAEELDIFEPGNGPNGGIQSLDLPALASSSEPGNDPNGGIQFLCLSALGVSPALPTTARAAMPSPVGLTLVGLRTARGATPSSELLAAPTAGPTDLPAARAAMPPLDPSERAASGAL